MEITNQTILDFYQTREIPVVREGTRTFTFPLFIEKLEVFNFEEEELTVINQLFRNINDDPLYLLQQLGGYSKDGSKSKTDQIYDDLQFIKKRNYEELDDELFNNFIEKNSKRLIIDKATKFNFNFLWYEERSILEGNDFVGYPLLELSRVGFNNDRTKCLLYRGYQAAPLAGDGCYIIMKKKNGLWISKKNKALSFGTWRS